MRKSEGGSVAGIKREMCLDVDETPIASPSHDDIKCSEEISEFFVELEIPKLDAIIYAEFDNDIGRVVKYQVPRDIFDRQHFESISSAIIPMEEMRGRMIKINMFDYRIIGFPVGIKDKRYPREVYIFNMCFILAKRANQCDIVYEPLVQKCAEYLVELEKERFFLSNENSKLPSLMLQIFDGLNAKGECVCTVTDLTTIYLKICPTFQKDPPPQINLFLVPIFTCIPPPTSFDQLNRMDVLSQKICPYIDGVRCVKDIATAIHIDPDLVGRCIRNLCYHRCIVLLPLFLYSNKYVPTENVRHFFRSPKIIRQCLEFVKREPNSPEPQFSDVARLYLNLKRGWSLADWAIRMQPKQANIDERKLIQFGIFYKFVRKLTIYPIAVNRIDPATKIESLCNGDMSLEDLAQHYSCSPLELHRRLQENGKFRLIIR